MKTSESIYDPAEPFCSNCGCKLAGLTEASKCPQCDRPLVDVLTRASLQRRGTRWQSKARLFGLPLVSIASGPWGAERIGRPRGIVAIGDLPLGVIAIGGVARGVVAIGGVAVGVIGTGGLCVAGLAIGGCAIGVVALGGFAAGLWSFGGLAIYLVDGFGGQRIPIRL